MRNHEEYIRQTYALAQSGVEKGNHPYGALLVINHQVAFTAENSVITDQDVTRHAELNLVSRVSRKLSSDLLGRSMLSTSRASCAMCTGALFWAGIPDIV